MAEWQPILYKNIQPEVNLGIEGLKISDFQFFFHYVVANVNVYTRCKFQVNKLKDESMVGRHPFLYINGVS